MCFFFVCHTFLFFFFNDTATTEIYTLSLHDALPISPGARDPGRRRTGWRGGCASRSEEHTSELQSQFHLVCRLLLEKKKNQHQQNQPIHTHTDLLPLPTRPS